MKVLSRTIALALLLAPLFPLQALEPVAAFTPGTRILFQGDSITDSNREKAKELPNDSFSLGSGYAFMGASQLLYSNPKKN